MPPVPHGVAGAGREVGGSEDGRARRVWVDSDGSPPVTLGTPLDGKKGEWLRKWPPPAARARASAQTGHPDHATGRLRAHAP